MLDLANFLGYPFEPFRLDVPGSGARPARCLRRPVYLRPATRLKDKFARHNQCANLRVPKLPQQTKRVPIDWLAPQRFSWPEVSRNTARIYPRVGRSRIKGH